MQFYSLDRASRPALAYDRDVAGLVAKVGRPGFPEALFKFAHGWIRADHVTAFAFDAGQKVRMVFAENTGTIPIARSLAGEYVKNYWRFDPAQPGSKRQCGSVAQCWAACTSASDISHSSYRSSCYTSVELDNRFSISSARGSRTIRLNFYRSAGDDFSEADADHILDSGNLLLALVARHCEEAWPDVPQERQSGFGQRLLQLAPQLSRREREVCALIAEGLTSEGIGLRLNVGINTVHTYRKRAYARLNISSQNELMRLIMRQPSGAWNCPIAG